MRNFYLFTTEIAGRSAAIKFEAQNKNTTIFTVTILSYTSIKPFTMNLEKGRWHVNADGCLFIKSIEENLIDAAKKFQSSKS